MPYNYTWVPKIKRPDQTSRISIKTWDGKPVYDTNIQVADGKINITVQSANRYKISVFTGPVTESTTVEIPKVPSHPSLNDRVLNIEKALQDGTPLPGGSSNISLVPDPENEGFFLLEVEDPNA